MLSLRLRCDASHYRRPVWSVDFPANSSLRCECCKQVNRPDSDTSRRDRCFWFSNRLSLAPTPFRTIRTWRVSKSVPECAKLSVVFATQLWAEVCRASAFANREWKVVMKIRRHCNHERVCAPAHCHSAQFVFDRPIRDGYWVRHRRFPRLRTAHSTLVSCEWKRWRRC